MALNPAKYGATAEQLQAAYGQYYQPPAGLPTPLNWTPPQFQNIDFSLMPNSIKRGGPAARRAWVQAQALQQVNAGLGQRNAAEVAQQQEAAMKAYDEMRRTLGSTQYDEQMADIGQQYQQGIGQNLQQRNRLGLSGMTDTTPGQLAYNKSRLENQARSSYADRLLGLQGGMYGTLQNIWGRNQQNPYSPMQMANLGMQPYLTAQAYQQAMRASKKPSQLGNILTGLGGVAMTGAGLFTANPALLAGGVGLMGKGMSGYGQNMNASSSPSFGSPTSYNQFLSQSPFATSPNPEDPFSGTNY